MKRIVLLSQRAADDYMYTDRFFGYKSERKELSDGY
jgi:hypothetical protein